ncbi:MAG: ATP-dependent Clp protease proteolytic subunit [Limisphaerales bacterium]
MNPIPPSNSPPINKPVNLVFVGPIQNPAVKNLRNVCCNTITTGTREIQILFSSGGGAVDEGFALYTFLRALPVKLTMHAIGNVDSIALVVFLAGEHRFCSPNATFLFHDFAWGTNGAINQTRSQWADVHALLERMKTQSQDLLKLRTALTDEDLQVLELYDKSRIQSASFAKEKGIVQEIKDVSIPAGSIIANIDF